MGYIFLPFRFLGLIGLVLFGLSVTGIFYRFFSQTTRNRLTRAWSKVLLKVCGIKLEVEGQPIMNDAVMWASNHISWVDIFILDSLRTTYFIAKKEINRWFIIGKLVEWVGTIFIDRSTRQGICQVSIDMEDVFSKKSCVGLFPEGTTSDGRQVLPLYSGLFDPPLKQHIPIQPVLLQYYHRGQPSTRFAFIGTQNLLSNMWILLSATKVTVKATFLEPVIGLPEGQTRMMVAKDIRRRLEEVLLASS